MSAFRKKVYGYVRPVKAKKVAPPVKPSMIAYNGWLREIGTAALGRHIDVLSKMLYWWDGAVTYAKHKIPVELQSIEMKRAFLAATESRRKGQEATTIAEKEKYFVAAIGHYSKFAKKVIDVAPIAPVIVLYKAHTKKAEKAVKELAPRFDSFLHILAASFKSCPFKLQAVPGKHTEVKREVDHALNKIMYTRPLLIKMQKQFRSEGLLAVCVDEARHIARAMAYQGTNKGAYLVDREMQFNSYTQLMTDVVEFAANHPNAPNRLVKRKVDKPKRERVARGPKTIKLVQKSIASQLLDELTQKGQSK
jgi:hypothetical protein